MRILFVDDVPDTRFIFRTVLELEGHEVRLAADGPSSIEIVRDEPPFDVIVMDIAMPEMDGWEATSVIRTLPAGRTPMIVIFSAHYRKNFDERAAEVGANYVLQKPLSPSSLLDEVHRLLEERVASQS